eukprot:11145663-Lingulodinium_polyedra.AAC.1
MVAFERRVAMLSNAQWPRMPSCPLHDQAARQRVPVRHATSRSRRSSSRRAPSRGQTSRST